MKFVLPIFAFVLMLTGCANRAAQAPVPGAIDTYDAYAYRVTQDAAAVIHSVKLWETCSDQNFPATVKVETNGPDEACDAKSGQFPTVARQPLFKAEQSYNIAIDAAMAYHAGASKDYNGLTAAVTQLAADISALLTTTGGK